MGTATKPDPTDEDWERLDAQLRRVETAVEGLAASLTKAEAEFKRTFAQTGASLDTLEGIVQRLEGERF
jgi:hypothetical protein